MCGEYSNIIMNPTSSCDNMPQDLAEVSDVNRRTVLKTIGAGAVLGGTIGPVAAQAANVTIASSEISCYEEDGTLWEDYSYTLSDSHWIHQHFVVIDAGTGEELDTAPTLVGDVRGQEINDVDGREDLGEYAQEYNDGAPIVLDIVVTDAESGEQIDRIEAPEECYLTAVFGEPPVADDEQPPTDNEYPKYYAVCGVSPRVPASMSNLDIESLVEMIASPETFIDILVARFLPAGAFVQTAPIPGSSGVTEISPDQVDQVALHEDCTVYRVDEDGNADKIRVI